MEQPLRNRVPSADSEVAALVSPVPEAETAGYSSMEAHITADTQLQPAEPDYVDPAFRKSEMWSLFYIGAPVALTFLSRTGMMFTDIAILGHLETRYLAAASLSNVWQSVTICFLDRGIGGAATVLCAQAMGAKNYPLVGLYFQQSLVWALLCCIPIAVCWMLTEPVLLAVGTNADEAHLAALFSYYSLVRLVPQAVFYMVQRYLQAIHSVIPVMWVCAIFTMVNLGLNMFLIHGWGSFRGLGFIGSPLATGFTQLLMIVALWAVVFRFQKRHAQTWPGWRIREALRGPRIRQFVLKQAVPLGIGACFEQWQLECLAVFASAMGSVQIATHNATLSVFFVLTSFMYGISTAISVRVGRHLGAGSWRRANAASRYGLGASIFFGAVIAGILALARDSIGKMYSSDPAVWRESARIQGFVALCYFALSLFYYAMSTLDGQGRPIPVAIAFLIGAWMVGVPLAYVMGFTLKYHLPGIWYGLACGYGVVTIATTVIVYRSDWRALAAEAMQRAEGKARRLAEALGEDPVEGAGAVAGAGSCAQGYGSADESGPRYAGEGAAALLEDRNSSSHGSGRRGMEAQEIEFTPTRSDDVSFAAASAKSASAGASPAQDLAAPAAEDSAGYHADQV